MGGHFEDSRGACADPPPIDLIYSRYIPDWLVAPNETGDLAKAFIAATITAAGVPPRVVHADRGDLHDVQTRRTVPRGW